MREFVLLPPPPGKCRICAVEHHVDQPHDATSFYYRWLFNAQYGRSPTWADAMLHCPEEIRQERTKYLERLGIDINSTNLYGDIKSQADLDKRLELLSENPD
jgi:hypothetical protein